jgi:hypothetical protein
MQVRRLHDIRRRVRQYTTGGTDGTPPGVGADPVSWVMARYRVNREYAKALIRAALEAGRRAE